MNITPPNKQPVTIFELGHLVVFCYQTQEEFYAKTPSEEVYWGKKDEPFVHGPFFSIWQAVANYTDYQKKNKAPIPDNVMIVDFRAKKRLK